MSWKGTVNQILAKRRQRLGEPPSTEELIRLREDDLPEEERERILEHASVDPELARRLFDLLRFPELPDDEDEPTMELSLDVQIQAMWERLAREGYAPEPDRRISPVARPWLRYALPIAASFAVLIGIFLLLPFRLDFTERPQRVSAPMINLPVAELVALGGPIDLVRSPERLTLPRAADGIVVSLSVPDLPPTKDGPYRLAIESESTTDSVELHGLRPGPGGVFILTLPRRLLVDGENQLVLRDLQGREIARFLFEVTLAR